MAPRIGDWAVLEVESIDWLPVQGKTKKPLYQMEGMRHMKITYSLSPEELEYMLGGLSDYTQMVTSSRMMTFVKNKFVL